MEDLVHQTEEVKTIIVGLSGKKGSGKNTSANFIVGLELIGLGLIDRFEINEKGLLEVHQPDWPDNSFKLFDVMSRNEEVMQFCYENIWPRIKLYALAEPLKNLVINLFNIPENQLYGTNDEKNILTHLLWDNLSYQTRMKYWKERDEEKNKTVPRTGYMTAREVTQVFGTDLMRTWYNDIWVDLLIRRIKVDNPELAIITDVRFPNEIEAIKNAGGKVIRLTRSPYDDKHDSEVALDDYNDFDYVLDNKNMSIAEQNIEINKVLNEWGVFNYEGVGV